MTPGGVDATVTQANLLETICAPGYVEAHPGLSAGKRARVFKRYHIARSDRRRYLVDHLVPISLGGSDDVENLWPQPKRDAKAKDVIEQSLATEVCAGHLELLDAQRALTSNWVDAESVVEAARAEAAKQQQIQAYLAALAQQEALRQYLASLPEPTAPRRAQRRTTSAPTTSTPPNLPTEPCRPDGSNAPNCIFIIPTTTSPY